MVYFNDKLKDLRQDTVVVDMIPVVARLISENDFLQPLHASATDLAWYYST